MSDYQIEKNLDYFDHPSDMLDSKIKRKERADAYANWLLKEKDWTGFITLTFRKDVAIDTANRKFYELISLLNRDVFGNHYTRIVRHSYFSYARATEPQKRDVVHFHFLVDRPVNYDLIHRFWNAWAGFGWTVGITDQIGAVIYTSKYVSKGGELDIYFAKKKYMPLVIPKWWKEDEKPKLADWSINS